MAEVISFTGKLDFSAATDMHATLTRHASQDMQLDLEDVSQIGMLCLQVLVSAAKTAQAQGTGFELIRTPPRVRDQMALMGMPIETLLKGTL